MGGLLKEQKGAPLNLGNGFETENRPQKRSTQ